MLIEDDILRIPVMKIKNIVAEISDITYDIIPDKVFIQGIIDKQIYYVGTDNVVHYINEEMPFTLFIDIIGALPGMAAEIDIDIEKILSYILEDGCVIRQKVLLDIFVRIIGEDQANITENHKQILIEGDFSICLPPDDIFIEYENIVSRREETVICQQKLLQSIFELEYNAEKIININLELEEINTEIISDSLLIVRGNILKDIIYVADNIVRHQDEILPFSISVNLSQSIDFNDISPEVLVEYIGFALIDEGRKVNQTIILKVCIRPEIIEIFPVVSSITGSGIVTETVTVEEEILVSEVPFITEVKIFPVVIVVHDPEGQLSQVKKDIVILNILNQGSTSIEVIVFAKAGLNI